MTSNHWLVAAGIALLTGSAFAQGVEALPVEDAGHVETLRHWLDSSSGANP